MKNPRIAVLVRRLLAKPNNVDSDDILGPCEIAALHAAARLAGPSGSITAIALGRARREDKALAAAVDAGCDRSIRVYDQGLDKLDVVGKAKVLARACSKIGAEVILCGDRSQDTGHAALGPSVAEALAIPHLTQVFGVHRDGPHLVAQIRDSGKRLTIKVPTPIVLCVRHVAVLESPSRNVSKVVQSEMSLKDLGIKPRSLSAMRHLSVAKEVRTGNSTAMANTAAELVSRLAEDRLI